jgi:hypothetical protein
LTKRGSPAGPLDFVFPPFPEESLTSWYVRLARANAISLHELATKLLGHSTHSIATSDLDANANSVIPDGLARIVGLPFEEIRLLTLWGWQHRFSAQVCDPRRATRWILPQRKDGSGRRAGEWTQACLQCLATDRVPFFRAHWRFAFVTECVVHEVELTATCPQCDQPLDFPRMDRGVPRPQCHWPLSRCPTCGVDWRIYAQTQRASNTALWRLQRGLLRGFSNRWILLSERPIWIGLFLDGVYHLLRCFRSSAANPSPDGQAPMVPANRSSGSGNLRAPFEHLPIADRRTLLMTTTAALAAWPVSFAQAARRFGFTLSTLHGTPGGIPYWLESVGHSCLDRTWFRQSPDETTQAKRFLERYGVRASKWVLREWQGFFVPKPRFAGPPLDRRQYRLWAIEKESERMLFQSFIRRAAKLLRKWCFSRTKVTRLAVPRDLQADLPLVRSPN